MPRGRLDLQNLQGERSYVGLAHYNQTKLALMAMSPAFAQRCPAEDVTINVAYPGHAYTSMNQGLATSVYPRAARPIVPLLRRAMPVLYGGAAVARASRSSVHLAAGDEVAGVHGAYFSSRARRTAWPATVRDARTREAVWALCEELSGLRTILRES